ERESATQRLEVVGDTRRGQGARRSLRVDRVEAVSFEVADELGDRVSVDRSDAPGAEAGNQHVVQRLPVSAPRPGAQAVLRLEPLFGNLGERDPCRDHGALAAGLPTPKVGLLRQRFALGSAGLDPLPPEVDEIRPRALGTLAVSRTAPGLVDTVD